MSREHVIIIGGSIAGLLVARAVAAHFNRVTVVERNHLSSEVGERKGIPQAMHAHALLGRGRMLIEEFFPGFVEELVAAGAVQGDSTAQSVRYLGGGFHTRQSCGMTGLMASRVLIEKIIRARLIKLPNVELRSDSDVTGIIPSDDRRRIVGVQLDGSAGAASVLHADVVIDASGRGSRLPAWLRMHGYTAPEEERIDVDLVYTTQWLRRTPDQFDGATSIIINGLLRGGVALAQENERWVISLAAYRNQGASADVDGMRAFAGALPVPTMQSLLSATEPLTQPTSMRFPYNQRRHYNRLTDLPQGLLVCGDAFCSFNPMYAQGMTVAAMQASVLAEVLASSASNVERRYFKAAARIVNLPWTMVARNDARLLGAEKTSAINRFVNFYIDRLHVAARTDVQVAAAFSRVLNLIKPPLSLFSPAVVWRVVRAAAWPAAPSALPYAETRSLPRGNTAGQDNKVA